MLSILINKTSGGGRESNPPKTLKPFNSFEDCGAHQALIHLNVKTSYIKIIIGIELNVMKSFQQTFNELKKARGLSNKQIASFTGVKLKDVKQWETGTSFPIETKVVDALEGLLGTEISKSLEGYTSQSKVNSQLKTSEDNIFIVKNEKLDVTNTKIDKLRNLFKSNLKILRSMNLITKLNT